MRLFRTEMRRLWSRRFIRALFGVVVAGVVVAGVVTFLTHSPDAPSATEYAAVLRQQVDSCRSASMDDWARAQDSAMGDTEYEAYVRQFPTAEAFADEQCRPEYFGFELSDPRFCLVGLWEARMTFRRGCPDLDIAEFGGPEVFTELEPGVVTIGGRQYREVDSGDSGVVPGMSVALLVVAAVIGASFIGAEYKAGTIETTLVWEPRRGHVLAAKLAAGAVSSAVIHITVLVLLVAAFLPAAWWRGSTAGVDAGFWWGIISTIGRGGAAAALVATLALTVSLVARNTAAGVAVLVGYMAVSPAIVRSLFRAFRPWDLAENVVALARGGDVGRYVGVGDNFREVADHGAGMAGVYVLGYVLVFVVVAGWVFKTRDVT